MNQRDEWAASVGLLREYLRDDLALARAIRERRWADLAAVAELANADVDHSLAVTDPVLYRTLRDAITKYHLRGYACLSVHLLRLKAARGRSTPRPPHSRPAAKAGR